MAHTVNETVDVITACQSSSHHKLVPKVMHWHNQTYTFTRLGLRHPTKLGRRMVHVFDMADDSHCFRLEFDAESLLWTLRSVSDGL